MAKVSPACITASSRNNRLTDYKNENAWATRSGIFLFVVGGEVMLEQWRQSLGGSLGGSGCLDVGGVELHLSLTVVGGALFKFGQDKLQDFVVGQCVDLGALAFLLGPNQAGCDALGTGGEPHRCARAVHECHVVTVAGRAAPASHNNVGHRDQFMQCLGLNLTEPGFSQDVKDLGNGHAALVLDELVEIDIGGAGFMGKGLAQSGLAATHVTDEKNRFHFMKL